MEDLRQAEVYANKFVDFAFLSDGGGPGGRQAGVPDKCYTYMYV